MKMAVKKQTVRAGHAATVVGARPQAKSLAVSALPGTSIPVPAAVHRWRKFDRRFYENMAGQWIDFSYGQLRRDGRGQDMTATGYLREKLRWPAGSLDAAPLARDVVGNNLVLPPAAPDLLSRPAQIWALVDDDSDTWKADRHLLVSVSLW